MRLSRGTLTAPVSKQVFRRTRPFADLVGLYDEQVRAGTERLLEPVMIGGSRRGAREPIGETRARVKADLDPLPTGARSVSSPRPPVARATVAPRQPTPETRRRVARRGCG